MKKRKTLKELARQSILGCSSCDEVIEDLWIRISQTQSVMGHYCSKDCADSDNWGAFRSDPARIRHIGPLKELL